MVCARIQCCPCLRPCAAEDQLSPLMMHGETVRFRRGEQLWQRGDQATHVYSLCTGTWKLTQPWEEGREVILDLAHRGQMVGEEAAIPGSTRLNGCVALSAGKAVRVSREVLALLVREDPKLTQTMLQTSYQRARAVSTRLEEMTVGSVRSRVARVLLRLAEEEGLDDARGRFVPVPLRRGDLADLVACRVETVIRVMTDWQRREVIDTQREGFVIRSLQDLKHDAMEG